MLRFTGLALLLAALLVLPFDSPLLAQDRLIATVELPASALFAWVDRPGDLYVLLADGEMLKYDKDGNKIASKRFQSQPDLFDPRDGTMSFAYFRADQHMEYLSPDMQSTEAKALHPEFAISAWLTCPSKNELWIFDAADFSLKKTKERGTAIAYESIWSREKGTKTQSITLMREYLNFLFVLDRSGGIYLFNNLGKEIRRIEATPTYFNFIGEELYFPQGNSLHLIDLYTAETREIQLPHDSQFAMLTDERMILVSEKRVEFYAFKP